MSHLCTMHHPPRSCERTGGDHFGERNSWRVETAPSLPLLKHLQHLSLSLHLCGGSGITFEESTFNFTPQFLTKEEEFSTYPSSGLCWRDIYRVTYFQVSVRPHSQDQISDRKAVFCYISCLLCRWSKQSVTVSAHLGKAAHPSYLS